MLLLIFLSIKIIVIRSNLIKKITGKTGNDGAKDVEIMVPFKYLCNFWRTIEMPLINCEISLMLTWSKDWFLIAGTLKSQNPTFTITDTELCVKSTNSSFFKNSFFPSVIIEWNKLDPEIENAPSVNIFKKNILKFVRPTTNNIFGCHHLKDIRYLTR